MSKVYKIFLIPIIAAMFGCSTSNIVTTEPIQPTPPIAEVESAARTLPIVAPYQPTVTRYFDLIHTRLDVSFDWQERQLNGVAQLELRPYFEPQDMLVLDARQLNIHSIVALTDEKADTLYFEQDSLNLYINLNRKVERSEHLYIQISYTAAPYSDKFDWVAKDERGLYFVNAAQNQLNQIWTQGETTFNSTWFPTIDAPNERCTQEMYITVPDSLVTLSNGVLVYSSENEDGTRTDYWEMTQPHAPYLFMMAIGDFAIVSDELGELDVSYYVDPSYASQARKVFGNTPEMIEFYSVLFDYDYPWQKYAQVVVHDFVSGAMENTTASVFMQDLQADSADLVDYNWDEIIAHELAHQWFGDLVTCESWSNIALNEALATYAEYLWYEYKYGENEAEAHNQENWDEYLYEALEKQEPIIRYYYNDANNDLFDAHTYEKGAAVLHYLRNVVGDEAFFESLALYLDLNEYSAVELVDLRLAFEQVTGQDLQWFFDQWFLQAGHPVLNVTHKYDSGVVEITVEQVQEGELFSFPVEINIWVNGQVSPFLYTMKAVAETFAFDVESAPDLISVDPRFVVPAEIYHVKNKKEWKYQFEHEENLRAKLAALDALSDSLDTEIPFFMKATHHKSAHIRQAAIASLTDLEIENNEVNQRFMTLAREDSASLVRADALSALVLGSEGQPSQELVELFRHSLMDSSASVIGTALFGLSEWQVEDIDEIINDYRDYPSVNIRMAAISYLANKGDSSDFSWFVQQVEQSSRGVKPIMLNFFGYYLSHLPDDLQNHGLYILESYARHDEDTSIRLAAYQALDFLTIASISEKKQEIADAEQDEKLREKYNEGQ